MIGEAAVAFPHQILGSRSVSRQRQKIGAPRPSQCFEEPLERQRIAVLIPNHEQTQAVGLFGGRCNYPRVASRVGGFTEGGAFLKGPVVAELVREIEAEGERERAGSTVISVEKILWQNPMSH